MKTAVNNYIGSLNWGYRVSLRDKNVNYVNAYAEFVEPHKIKVSGYLYSKILFVYPNCRSLLFFLFEDVFTSNPKVILGILGLTTVLITTLLPIKVI